MNTLDFFDEFPVLEIDDRTYLRKIDLARDVSNFNEYITSKEVTKFLSDSEIPKSLQEAELELGYWASLVDRKRSFYWAIANKDTDELIGTAGFNSWSKTHNRAEISYDLSYRCWNKGIMTRVVNKITDFAFNVMKVHRVQATVVHYNIGSCKVLEKCGYVKEGEMVNYGVLHGKSENFFMYSITR